MILMKQFGNQEAPDLAKEWRGDYFCAAIPLQDTAGKRAVKQDSEVKPQDLSLIFVSRWVTAVAAHRFASFYRDAIPRRYSGATSFNAGGTPIAANRETWSTPEGTVTVKLEGNLVIAIEGFDDETATRIEAAVLKADKP
jgi:hypothetical protein